MTKADIISKVKTLNLPENSYVVFGSSPMAVAGIRESRDVDMLVSQAIYEKLKKDGWQEILKASDDKPLTRDVFEVHNNWNFSSYNPTLEYLLSTATVVDDVPFASLDEVRKWKSASSRPKDLVDIELIDCYYSSLQTPVCKDVV